MSGQHASTEDSKGAAVREALRRVAPTIRNATATVANDALAKGLKPKKKGIAERLGETPRSLSKKLPGKGRSGSRRLRWPGLPKRDRTEGKLQTMLRDRVSMTSPRSWWQRARSMSDQISESTGEAAAGRRVSPAITVVSAAITVATAVITFSRTKDRLRRFVGSRDSEPHSLAKSVDSALELIERALAEEPHDRRMRPRARRRRSRSPHPAHRR
jgi:hypothetical protein